MEFAIDSLTNEEKIFLKISKYRSWRETFSLAFLLYILNINQLQFSYYVDQNETSNKADTGFENEIA